MIMNDPFEEEDYPKARDRVISELLSARPSKDGIIFFNLGLLNVDYELHHDIEQWQRLSDTDWYKYRVQSLHELRIKNCVIVYKISVDRDYADVRIYKDALLRYRDRINQRVNLNKQTIKNEKKYPKKLPVGAKWENITIRFLNEQDILVIIAKDAYQTNFATMGFADSRDKGMKRPNKQWELLRLLALKGGELSWDNNSDLPAKDASKVKQTKYLLSESLKSYFNLADDPFNEYRKEKAYKIRMILEQSAIDEPSETEDKLGIEASMKDMMT